MLRVGMQLCTLCVLIYVTIIILRRKRFDVTMLLLAVGRDSPLKSGIMNGPESCHWRLSCKSHYTDPAVHTAWRTYPDLAIWPGSCSGIGSGRQYRGAIRLGIDPDRIGGNQAARIDPINLETISGVRQ